MNRFWKYIIEPIIKKIDAKFIIEVGSDKGVNTTNILEYCKQNDAFLDAIDPFPSFDHINLLEQYKANFKMHLGISLEVLTTLHDYDMVLLDGDHNWYTVYNELSIIDKLNNKKPVVFIHDVMWPYARRDMYYEPSNIPNEYKIEFEKNGIIQGKNELDNSGINSHLFNAVYEGGAHNGVLTAIEDFIKKSESKWKYKQINFWNGLAMLYTEERLNEEYVNKLFEKECSNIEVSILKIDNQTLNDDRYKAQEIMDAQQKELDILNAKLEDILLDRAKAQEIMESQQKGIEDLKEKLKVVLTDRTKAQEIMDYQKVEIDKYYEMFENMRLDRIKAQEIMDYQVSQIDEYKKMLTELEEKDSIQRRSIFELSEYKKRIGGSSTIKLIKMKIKKEL